ncbi:MAG: F0F1 ATP synthase subunit alpha [Kiritimatiellia bacterium]
MIRSGGSRIPLFKMKVEEKGVIKDVKEIIARIQGLPTCLNGQIVDMGDGVRGIIMGYDENDVLALVLGDQGKLKMGKDVSGVSEPFTIPVGEGFVGRVVTAMGEPADQGKEIDAAGRMEVFKASPPIVHRAPVDRYLSVGTKVVDVLIPVAMGQRQLILGDRMTGKTVVCVDAIINQKDTGMICIYCCVGKSVSGLQKTVSTLKKAGALDYTVIMAATDNAPVGEQYIVPFAAASMGDYFAQKGKDVLIVFDDLTKHAWAYRQLSLLLERPPGREAYPGDIFYVQTQLMERAGRFNEKYGGGSMTFLGIAETLQGDLTGYIPSNLASMCDGQVCMSNTMFAEGYRPAIDFTLSLSIIGGRVQPPRLKSLSSKLRADYAQYSELVKLSKLQSGLSGEAEKVFNRGRSIMAVLQQGQFDPVTLAEVMVLLYALDKGVVENLPEDKRAGFNKEIYDYVKGRSEALVTQIQEKVELTPDMEKELDAAIEEYVESRTGDV